MNMFVLGIDCAAQPENTGLALARIDEGVEVLRVHRGRRGQNIAELAADFCAGREPLLVALDAPLGWPAAMGPALAGHRAGEPLGPEPNAMLRRATDDLIANRIGKRPLDVGGDRIARAAHSALRILEDLRRLTGRQLQVITRRGEGQVLEVYPAATLHVRGLRSSGYKGTEAHGARQAILGGLGLELEPELRADAIASDHVLDAILCCLAARDYVSGRVLEPGDEQSSRVEGWIWVGDPRLFRD